MPENKYIYISKSLSDFLNVIICSINKSIPIVLLFLYYQEMAEDSLSCSDFAKAEIFYRTFCLVKSNISESKFAGPKNLSGILTNKSEISPVATLFALANTIILHHAVSSLKQVAHKIYVPVAVLAEEIWDAFICIPFFRGLAPSFRANSYKRVLAWYTTTRTVLLVT